MAKTPDGVIDAFELARRAFVNDALELAARPAAIDRLAERGALLHLQVRILGSDFHFTMKFPASSRR
jgi:hypothetical protein